MQDKHLVEKVQGLTDIELAVLLSLVAGQHCIIDTEEDLIEALAAELQLVSNAGFAAMASQITHPSKDCLEYIQASINGSSMLREYYT